MNTNADIIAGCQKGDRKAQELLYKNYFKVMITLCRLYTKDEQHAVEVLNNGFLKVFTNFKSYEPKKASLYTWIRTIIINSCLDFLKLKERMITHELLDSATETVHIDAEAIEKMNMNDLLFFIQQLPAATMAVFNLYVMEGFTHKEIAGMLNISDGTSKWHLSHAKKFLQQRILSKQVKYER